MCQRFGVTKCSKTMSYVASRRLDGEHGRSSVDIPYRGAVDSMIWVAVMTQPDIAISVRDVAKYSIELNAVHWPPVKDVLGYLNTHLNRGATFGGPCTRCELRAYANAPNACCRNDSRSVTGGAIIFYGGAVSWVSKTQRIVAMSTTESEYIALSAVAQEVLLVRSVHEFLQPNVEKCVF
ncbi:unnamed protein product [Discosporangium mesarthrocarpum]